MVENYKIQIGKSRNLKENKQHSRENVKNNYNWIRKESYTKDFDHYELYFFNSRKNGRPVPKKEGNVFLSPPIWEGMVLDAPIKFYNQDNELDQGFIASQLHKEWGEGLYQVQRFPGGSVSKIKNIFEPALVVKKN